MPESIKKEGGAKPSLERVSFRPQAPETTETPKEIEPREPVAREEDRSALARTIERLTPKRKQKIAPAVSGTKDPLTVSIEKIMEENLESAYAALSPHEREEFKMKGEKTAIEIRQLLSKTRVKIKKIFLLIVEWLSFLPGVNRFYLEQEAKIKADKILALKYFDREGM